jgi:hypothetical protein
LLLFSDKQAAELHLSNINHVAFRRHIDYVAIGIDIASPEERSTVDASNDMLVELLA